MRNTLRIAALLLAIAILVSALGGCKSNQDAKTTGRNEINVAIAQDIDDSLDPHKMTGGTSREVMFNVFEGLVKPTPEGNLVPAVASLYSISDSGDTFTFTLRDAIRFHNGNTVTVEDVVYSISRCAGLLNGEILIPAFAIVESVEAPDSKTVVIKTSEPNIEFLSYLTAAIIPADYSDLETKPIGTGPFKLVSRSPQESIVLERWDNYWGEKAGLERVTLKIIDNAETIVMSLKSGTVDFCAHLTSAQMKELENSGLKFEVGTMNLVQAVYLNNDVAPFDNVKVRQALSHAINRDEIMDFLADGLGVAVGSSMYPAFGKYFMPELTDYYNYDPELAKQLLAEAGYPDGFNMEIVVPSNHQPHIDTATVVVEQLRAAGVNATIKQVEWTTWLSDTYRSRNYQATLVGVEASYMTARAMLERFNTASGSNFINFKNDEYDSVFQAAISSTDDAEQVQLYKRLQTILTEEAANLYIQSLCDIVAINKNLEGFSFYPMFVLDLAALRYVN